MTPVPEVPKVEALGAPTEPPPVELVKPASAEKVYKFWNKAKCPRCGTMDTEAYATHGPVQNRRCRHPECRHRFSVTGALA